MSAWHKMSERESLFARRYKLSPSEGRIFCALHDAENYVPHQIVHAVSDVRRVLISTLRKKIGGYKITNIHGRGYRMRVRSHVRSIMRAEDR